MSQDFISNTPNPLLSREYSILLDSIYDGIWVIDANGITVHINKAMEKIANIKAEDVIGKHVSVPVKEGLFSTCVTLHALQKKQPVTMFDDYANGKRCLNTSTPIFDENGNIWRVIASVRDMTELQSLERKLADTENEAKLYKAGLEYLEAVIDEGFVGYSSSMRELRKQVNKAAKSDAITLILGETGTGKSHAAKVMHKLSNRSANPFISVNCGAIPLSLMESEMFGYEKGAFTGASQHGKPGLFELANNGTLLLDEISELPLSLQVKLLHVLDGHPFNHVGGTKLIETNVRVIAATNKPLEKLVEQGLFREDLYYRLRVLTLEIPPLRERQDDIPLLSMYFLGELTKSKGIRKMIEPEALNYMLAYAWPGNVRELKSIIQSMATMTEQKMITLNDLPNYMRNYEENTKSNAKLPFSLTKAIEDLEKNLIGSALTEAGSTYKAAKLLKVSQSTLFRKAKKYNIALNLS